MKTATVAMLLGLTAWVLYVYGSAMYYIFSSFVEYY